MEHHIVATNIQLTLNSKPAIKVNIKVNIKARGNSKGKRVRRLL